MSIEVGSKCQGKVTGITNFGAFVELPGGSTGLVHISEVADSYVKDINEFLTVGDDVTVKVMNVEKDGKIGLSIRKAKVPEEGTKKAERPARQPTKPRRKEHPSLSFEDKMNRFLKDSEERLSSLKRNTESKRGGRNTKRG
ncbi:S1 domain-containing RNA-binding protein [Salipaludibacillus sp. LMS25]|jgi:S1 RNA binding domain protein|uniref:S1 domain-containing RNA-binding protein n=1 Tax=Salipaludibacillus sp. LMS25 TaxID=2924031 RepID=UPI0020D1CA32|nr:S1 domain-containing RNA-binding protein [Salipaludibacillus sp. LMS25]UTR16663.1 S1 domain-containing RNA-binding protein [Salipaludibacillus sp. LMS25]